MPRKMWKTLDSILGKGGVTAPAPISADEFHRFFDHKVAAVRQNTAGAPPPFFTPATDNCRLSGFIGLSVEQVITATLALPCKQCASDPIPTQILKDNIGILAPFITHMFNTSLSLGVVPRTFKSAYVTPLIKKPDLDITDVKSYRPISNLKVLSKLLERLVASQLRDHIDRNQLLPHTQSAYRVNHSSETAVSTVNSDLLQAVDSGDVGVLVLFHL